MVVTGDRHGMHIMSCCDRNFLQLSGLLEFIRVLKSGEVEMYLFKDKLALNHINVVIILKLVVKQ